MNHSLDDLREALAEEPADLRPPDLHAVLADGHHLRRRRTTARGLGAAAAVVALGAGVVGATQLLPDGSGGGGGFDGVASTEQRMIDQASDARKAQRHVASRVGDFIGPVAVDEGAWSSTRPDGDEGSRALPRDDREWATLNWLRYTSDMGQGYRAFVLTDNGPDTNADIAAAEPGVPSDEFCTNVYENCRTERVAGGVVAIERGPGDGGRDGVRASFTPDDVTRSWVLAEITAPSGRNRFPIDRLVDLVTDPEMSLPSPLTTDELPEAG